MFICLASQRQHGKNLTADYLQAKLGYPWEQTAFAGTVKKIFCNTFDKDIAFVEEWKNREEIPPGLDMTVRKALQFIGDGFRKIKSSIWIDLVFRQKGSYIVNDCRYKNELQAVKEHGGLVIIIARPGFLNDDPNGSEAEIRPLVEWALSGKSDFLPETKYVDYVIVNNGTIKELYAKIDAIVPKIQSYFNVLK